MSYTINYIPYIIKIQQNETDRTVSSFSMDYFTTEELTK